jgi:hypothetical protein
MAAVGPRAVPAGRDGLSWRDTQSVPSAQETPRPQLRLALEERQLGAEAGGGIGRFEQPLLAAQLHLEDAGHRVAGGSGSAGR